MAEGIRIEVPDGAATTGEAWGPEFALPWGGKAQVRRSKGKDFRLAQMAIGEPFDAGKYDNALTARLCRINGKQATIEQIEALEGADFLTLKLKASEASVPPKPAAATLPAADDSTSSSSVTSSSPA